jgi:hypothetical protein
LHPAWTGTDPAQSLNTSRAASSVSDLRDGGDKRTLPDTSISGPSLAWIDEDPELNVTDSLLIGWTGRPGGPDHLDHLNIALSSGGLSPWGSKRTVAATSARGPALTTIFELQADHHTRTPLIVAWTEGASSSIRLSRFSRLPVIPT